MAVKNVLNCSSAEMVSEVPLKLPGPLSSPSNGSFWPNPVNYVTFPHAKAASRPDPLFPTPFPFPLIYNLVFTFFFAMTQPINLLSRFRLALSQFFKETKRLSLSLKLQNSSPSNLYVSHCVQQGRTCLYRHLYLNHNFLALPSSIYSEFWPCNAVCVGGSVELLCRLNRKSIIKLKKDLLGVQVHILSYLLPLEDNARKSSLKITALLYVYLLKYPLK
ncbi:hypothetical protein ACTXT7_007304 [Hymenolepis weldensis]